MTFLSILFFLVATTANACPKWLSKIEHSILCLSGGAGPCDTCSMGPSCAITREDAWKVLSDPKQDIKNFRNSNQQTALEFALSAHGRNSKHKGVACKNDDATTLKIANQLMARGADVNATGALGLTALHAAVLSEDPAVVRFLLENGAHPDVKAGAGKFQGMNVLEFGRYLQRKKAQPKIEAILESIRAHSPKAES